MPLQACKSNEPIPGYTITHRIGAGGYGEVWQAEAPGGIAKAIKFVYGFLSEERAANELKALNRIKEVRHPFLLSLERIEVVDGQLVILTELADASLKDRFEQLRADGEPGIPREELLIYLSDAADALDYMSAHHRLQHLDVKPENLLLVGGRVKVADFGLVKDVVATAVSVMGGMTPVYAAPEVFDGRPTGFSDQYSLAIVYQELLTGILPFSGKTPSQLAKQHSSSVPRLSPLPASDRETIARALSADPEQRFSSCRELIEGLRLGGRGSSSSTGTTNTGSDESDVDTKSVAARETQSLDGGRSDGDPPESFRDANSLRTAVFEEEGRSPSPAQRLVRRSTSHAERPAPRPAGNLPPLDLDDATFQLQPTLIVGVGGTASRVLKHFKEKVKDRFGGQGTFPTMRTLFIDTDVADLCRLTETGQDADRQQPDATLHTPLRKPQDYRCRSSKLLKWLSRRWLYNIPRSLKTEGLRPLGRLALVDHATEVYERLREALDAATSPSSAEACVEQWGLPFRPTPLRAFIVASVSGGTGSGMVLDVAYMLRQILEEKSQADARLCGFLLHSTPRTSSQRNLAEGNAFACLTELYNFSHAEGAFPGDPACNLPAIDGQTGTFDDTYVISLGSELTDRQYDEATDRVAEYLYINAVTPASLFFEACREQQKAEGIRQDPEPVVRTIGLTKLGFAHADLTAQLSSDICRAVLLRWIGQTDQEEDDTENGNLNPSAIIDDGTPQEASEIETAVRQQAGTRIANLKLHFHDVIEELDTVVQKHLGRGVDAYFSELLKAIATSRQKRSASPTDMTSAEQAIQTIRRIVGHAVDDDDDEGGEAITSASDPLDIRLREHVGARAETLRREISNWIFGVIDQLGHRVAVARATTSWLMAFLDGMEGDATERLHEVEHGRTTLARAILDAKRRRDGRDVCLTFDRRGRPKNEIARQLLQYAQGSVEATILRSTRQMVQGLRATLVEIEKCVRDIEREVVRVSDEFPRADRASGINSNNAIQAYVLKELDCRKAELGCLLDELLEAEFLSPRGGLFSVLSGNVDLRSRMPLVLREKARVFVLEALKEIDFVGPLLEDVTPEQDVHSIDGLVKTAQPKITGCGGFRRLLIIAQNRGHNDSLKTATERIAGAEPSLMHDTDPSVTLCHEVEQMPLPLVAHHVIDQQGNVVELASRLHTRIDVDWSPI